MRVVTYNIHKGIGGLDRTYRLHRIADVLRATNADVILLQEVDESTRRCGFTQQAQLLADELAMPHAVTSINHRLRRGGGYGNVTLSRWPIVDHYNLDISKPLKKRRGALYTQIDVPEVGFVHVINFHLGLLHLERVAQIKQILRTPCISESVLDPVLIGGDTNDWRGRLCHKLLAPVGFCEVSASLNGRRVATFPALRPLWPLDRLYVRHLHPDRVIRPEHPHLRHASDHHPIIVDFHRE